MNLVEYTFNTIFIIILLTNVSVGRSSNCNPNIIVDIKYNMHRLLDEEDIDKDMKITIADHYTKNGKGDKKFWLIDTSGNKYEISGTYYLSNLLQELKLQEDSAKRKASLSWDRIFENPVNRISRLIREVHWNGLTRKITEKRIKSYLIDTKVKTIDGANYIYIPHDDTLAFNYFSKIAHRHPDLKIKVIYLPVVITPEYVYSLKGRHGLLTLALRKSKEGQIEGTPYVVPGGRFNEMYGWDSYFIVLGLLADGKVSLAKSIIDNFVYEINHYGKILNANRTYYLTRSQPPFLTSMALAVYDRLPKESESKAWLRKVIIAAINEYKNVWMGEKRLTQIGLSRYYGEGIGQPPEVEPGHFDAVYRKFARKHNMNLKSFKEAYKSGKIIDKELDEFFIHDRSMRESGHDKTYRWNDRCADYVTVDLNSLLYKIEMDIAWAIKNIFNDTLVVNGEVINSKDWLKRAEKRRKLINKYLWDKRKELFLDYNFIKKKRKIYISATAFYPLWAGLATKEQATSIVENVLPQLEMPGGIVASTADSRGEVSEERPQRQWDYPYGWAPHQIIAWIGLKRYGFNEEANRLIYRWLYTITKNAVDYNGTITEKYDVVNRTHQIFVEYGNVGTKFSYITKEGFGWTNASYQVGLKMLTSDLREKLNQLIPPEWLWGN